MIFPTLDNLISEIIESRDLSNQHIDSVRYSSNPTFNERFDPPVLLSTILSFS